MTEPATIVAPSATTNGVVHSRIREPSFVLLSNFGRKPCVSCPDRNRYTSSKVVVVVTEAAVATELAEFAHDETDSVVDVQARLYARLPII